MTKNDFSTFALEFGKGFAYVLFGHRLGRRIERKISAKADILLMCALGRALKPKGERNKIMDKELVQGAVGNVELKISGGIAVLSAVANLDANNVGLSASVSLNAGSLVDQLEALVAAKIPASAALDPAIFAVIKEVVMAL